VSGPGKVGAAQNIRSTLGAKTGGGVTELKSDRGISIDRTPLGGLLKGLKKKGSGLNSLWELQEENFSET